MSESSPDNSHSSSIQEDSIQFFFEDVEPEPVPISTLKDCILCCSKAESALIKSINVIFCSDRFLSKLNSRYLHHNDLTDVITFPLSANPIEGDIYVSLDRVHENAMIYSGNDFYKELARVVIHGFLHLCGYSDKTEISQSDMRNKEDHYLNKCFRSHF